MFRRWGPLTGSEDESPGTRQREPDEATENREPGLEEIARNRKVEEQSTASRENSRDFSGLPAGFRADILDHGDRVIVVAELPGIDEGTIAIRLLNPQTLRITAKRTGHAGEREDNTLSRLIRLPASVITEGAMTGYRNGVLEVCLKKVGGGSAGGKEIPIG